MKSIHRASRSAALLPWLLAVSTPALCAEPPDAGFLTTYVVRGTSSPEYIDWSTCGNFPDGSGGCYGYGSYGPVGTVGALLEDAPTIVGKVLTRRVYVLDTASGATAHGVTLYVYKRVDTVVEPFPSSTYTLVKTLKLPLTGGTGARAAMAASAGFLYVGTNLSPQAVQIKKYKWIMTLEDPSSDPIPVTAIVANSYGYVTITHGSSSGDAGFNVYRPDGVHSAGGGGGSFTVDTRNAVVPANLPLFP